MSYGNRVYVANNEGASVSVIDAQTNNIVTNISVTGYPYVFAINSDGSRLYVADHGAATNTVSVIDTSTNTVLTTLTGFAIPQGLAVSNDDSKLYVVNSNNNPCCGSGNGYVTVFNTSDYTVVTTIPVGNSPHKITLSPDGTKLYVPNSDDNSVSVIDTLTNTVVNTISVGAVPRDVVFNASGTRAYVSNSYYSQAATGTVSVIDTASQSAIATVSVGSTPDSLRMSQDDTKLYVVNTGGDNTVSVINTSNNVASSFNAGSIPWAIAEVQKNSKVLSSVNPAQIWVSKGGLNLGVKFDFLAEVYKDSTLVTSGQVNSVQVGTGGFNNASPVSIPFNTFTPLDFASGSALKLKISVRNACSGSLLNLGTARLWYNDAAANSKFGATIDAASDYYLRSVFALTTTAGTGPRENISVNAGTQCSAFKPFGTWTITP